MIPPNLAYFRARTTDEALVLRAEHHGAKRRVAG